MSTEPQTSTVPQPLTGRIAVVTGATSGIGAATARSLVAAGAAVALVGRREELLDELTAELGPRVVGIAADITDSAAIARVAETVRESLGRVDLVVANAGTMLGSPWASADPQDWDRMIDLNVRGLLRTGHAFAADLLATASEGRPADLVHVSSTAAHTPFPHYGTYAATKAAVSHLTRSLRAELGPQGVRVKAVEPGLVATDLGREMTDPTAREMLAGAHQLFTAPLQPGDVADAIAYAVAAPPHVNVAEIILMPTQQG